jgi:hypothetical protein
MKSTLAFAVLLLETTLVTADYVKNGMIYEDGEPGIKGINARDTSAIPASEKTRPKPLQGTLSGERRYKDQF